MGHLHRAARAGDVDDIRATLAEGADIDAFSVHGLTALMVASWEGHANAIRVLIAAGARTDLTVSTNGQTALSFAASAGHADAVAALIESGATVDSVCRFGDTPLIGAARSLRHECVALLKQAGADAKRPGRGNMSADDWLEIGGIPGRAEQKFFKNTDPP